MAQNPGIGDLLRAVASGPAVMLVIPLEISPEAFFGASNVLALPASPGESNVSRNFLWDYLAVDKEGPPRRIGTGPYPRERLLYLHRDVQSWSHLQHMDGRGSARCRPARKRRRRGFRGTGPRPASTNSRREQFMTIIRALTEADLPEAQRIVRVAFGTFLGAPDPEKFWSDLDYVYGRFGAEHTAAFAAEKTMRARSSDRISRRAGAASASSDH